MSEERDLGYVCARLEDLHESVNRVESKIDDIAKNHARRLTSLEHSRTRLRVVGSAVGLVWGIIIAWVVSWFGAK